jgi:hypothetical protein
VDVTASGSAGTASYQFTWTVNPYVTVSPIADQSNTEGDSVYLPVQASDAGGASLTYTAAGLPPGLSLDPNSGVISGTVTAGDALQEPFVVTLTAGDGTYTSSQTFNWAVMPATPPAPPTRGNPGSQNNQADDSVSLQLQASDAAGYPLTYTATNLPDGLVLDPDGGLISGTIAPDAASTTPYQVTVTASDGASNTVSQTFSWSVNPSPISAQLAPQSPVEGVDVGPVTVATFTTTDLNSQLEDFTATVNYSNGIIDNGTVVGQNGSFSVTDDHVFPETGSYPITVTITSDQGVTVSTSGSVTVAEAPLTLTGGFQQGMAIGLAQSGFVEMAVLQDANMDATPMDFSAQANLGDGNGWVPVRNLYSLGEGRFAVMVPYNPGMLQGTYTVAVQVADGMGAPVTTSSTLVVGMLEAGPLATLTVGGSVPGPNPSPPTYTATIQWGDGGSSTVTVPAGSIPNSFIVQASHAYLQDSLSQPGGVYNVSVTVPTPNGVWSSTGTVVVVRPTGVGGGNEVVETPAGTLSNVSLGTFTEPDTSDPPAEFSATVNWGDGTPPDTTATVVGSNGVYQVLGSHTYSTAGTYTVGVQVAQHWDSALYFLYLQSAVLAVAAGDDAMSESGAKKIMSYITPGKPRTCQSDGDADDQKDRAQSMASQIWSKAAIGGLGDVGITVITAPVSAVKSPLKALVDAAKDKAAGDAKAFVKNLIASNVDVYTFEAKEKGEARYARMSLLYNRKTGDFIAIYEGQVGRTVDNAGMANYRLTDTNLQKFSFVITGKTNAGGTTHDDVSAIKWQVPK